MKFSILQNLAIFHQQRKGRACLTMLWLLAFQLGLRNGLSCECWMSILLHVADSVLCQSPATESSIGKHAFEAEIFVNLWPMYS